MIMKGKATKRDDFFLEKQVKSETGRRRPYKELLLVTLSSILCAFFSFQV